MTTLQMKNNLYNYATTQLLFLRGSDECQIYLLKKKEMSTTRDFVDEARLPLTLGVVLQKFAINTIPF